MEARERAERRGETAYGTSYPIRNCDELRRAIQSYGRAPASERARLRRFIARRRRELDCDTELPETWYAGSYGGTHVVVRSSHREKPEPDKPPSYKVRPDVPKRRKRRGNEPA